MKIAELKRRLKPGTKLRLVHTLMGPCDKARVVRITTTVDVQFAGDGIKEGSASHLRWPRAGDLRETAEGFEVLEGGEVAARYEWVADDPVDFDVEGHGDLTCVQPLSAKAADWLHANVTGEQTWLAGGLMVERAFAQDLVLAMQGADLVRKGEPCPSTTP